MSLLAGLSSGLFSTMLLQPLDVAKTRSEGATGEGGGNLRRV